MVGLFIIISQKKVLLKAMLQQSVLLELVLAVVFSPAHAAPELLACVATHVSIQIIHARVGIITEWAFKYSAHFGWIQFSVTKIIKHLVIRTCNVVSCRLLSTPGVAVRLTNEGG